VAILFYVAQNSLIRAKANVSLKAEKAESYQRSPDCDPKSKFVQVNDHFQIQLSQNAPVT